MANVRHQARIAAMQALYELDLAEHPVEHTIQRRLDDQPLPSEAAKFMQRLVADAVPEGRDGRAVQRLGHRGDGRPREGHLRRELLVALRARLGQQDGERRQGQGGADQHRA